MDFQWIIILTGLIGLLTFWFFKRTKRHEGDEDDSTDRKFKKACLTKTFQPQQKPQSALKQAKSVTNSKNEKQFTHPWLITTLKGHTDFVRSFDFSSNGKYIASCSDDRSILIWSCSHFEDTKNRKAFRINVEYDSAMKIAWSPDNKAVIINKSDDNCIEVYKFERKDNWFVNPTKAITFYKATDAPIIGFGIACTGRFMMTCTNTTELFIWDLRGNILEKITTCLINNYAAKVSPCGRFVAACGFAPDVHIWCVKFTKNGEYEKTVRAFDLSGHTSGIYDIAFDQDTSHIATVSKDGTWKLYSTKNVYELGKSPKCLKTGKYSAKGLTPLIALSINAEVLAIATANHVEFFSTLTTESDGVIRHIYEHSIIALGFDAAGKFLVTAGDKYLRIFHNVTGYKTAIAVGEEKLRGSLTAATRERIEKQVAESKDFLKKFAA